MQSQDFIRRRDAILAAKAEAAELEKAKARPVRRSVAAATSVVAALTAFFVLKGAALTASDQAFASAAQTPQNFADHVYHWFAGDDPVTRVVSLALGG